VRTRILLGPLTAVAVAACGTTVPVAQRVTAASDPLAPDAQGQPPATTPVVGGPRQPVPGTSQAPPSTDASAAPSAVASAVQGLGRQVTSHAVGVTDTTILVGAVVLKNGEAFANGLGFSISFGDARTEFQAVVDDLNRSGGVAGRKLQLLFAYYDLGGAAVDPEGQQAALCSTFTQDNHVFAVFMPYNPLPSFLHCLASRKTLVLNGSAQSDDDGGFQELAGWHIAPSMVSYSRYPRTLVTELTAHRFFSSTPKPKAAILVIDTPHLVRAAEQRMKPAIQAAGVPVETIARVNPSSSNADINSAVLQFKTLGVTHVFFVQAAGGLPLYFMQGADTQQYYPRYALSSFEVPGFFLQGQAPAAQLKNAMGIGWEPFFDLKANQLPSRPAEKRCLDVVTAGGETNANRQSNLTVTPVCDLVWSFAAAAEKAGRALDHTSWLAGLKALGGGYDSPVALHADFSSGRPDGAVGYRWVSYVNDCSCFRYSGPQRDGWE
jgi:ABC-type branched-subunit amino acid transport system substrate-binding protein